MIDFEKLVDEVKELRERGFSYSEIARTLEANGINVSRVTVMRWCKGLHDPRNRMNSVRLDPSPELAYIVGVMFGDGSVGFRRAGRSYRYRIRLKVVDREFAEEFKRCLEVIGLKPSLRLERDRSRCDRWCVEANSKLLYEFLKQPKEELFKVARMYPVEFLRGFFDSEGCVEVWKEHRVMAISASNYDLEILKFAGSLLGQLGIHSRIYRIKKRGLVSKIREDTYRYSSDLYSLKIYRLDDIRRYVSIIGFTIRRKLEKAKNLLK